jgi:Flp pilus assembly protein TadG
MFRRSKIHRSRRRGAVAVEFAFVAPVLLAVIVGLIELTRVYDVQNTLEMACREGARFAALDRDGMLLNGQTANQKLVSDVKNFLKSAGIDPEDCTVKVVKASDPAQSFDLDDPANDMQLFQVKISVPYSDVSYTPVSESHDYSLSAAITFRNGRATLSQ